MKKDSLEIQITQFSIDSKNTCKGATGNNNNLEAYYEQLVIEGKASADELAQVQQVLVGYNNCDAATATFLQTVTGASATTAVRM